jgi:hypothetical protein
VDEKPYSCQDGNAGSEPPIEQIAIFQFMTQQKVPVKDKTPVQGKKVVNNQSELCPSEKECERTYQKEPAKYMPITYWLWPTSEKVRWAIRAGLSGHAMK